MRRLLLAAAMGVAGSGALAEAEILAARYGEPTTRYAHGILGDAVEWGALEMTVAVCPGCAESELQQISIVLSEASVFEDVAPRLADVDGDGTPEVITVESRLDAGARLAIYDETGLVAATPHIGRPNRWLAPLGAADLDGDGLVEIAYVDRPHLARMLRVWRFTDGALVEVAALEGLTNHRIGEEDIAGGIRDCGSGPEMIVASADWQRLIAVRFDGARMMPEDIGPHRDRASFAAAMACD